MICNGFEHLPIRIPASVSNHPSNTENHVMWTPPSEIIATKKEKKKPSIGPAIIKIGLLVMVIIISTMLIFVFVLPLASEFLFSTKHTVSSEELRRFQELCKQCQAIVINFTSRFENEQNISDPKTLKINAEKIISLGKNIIMLQLTILKLQNKLDEREMNLKLQNSAAATSYVTFCKKFDEILKQNNNEDALTFKENNDNHFAVPEEIQDNQSLSSSRDLLHFEGKHLSKTYGYVDGEKESSTSTRPLDTEEFGRILREYVTHGRYYYDARYQSSE